MANSPHRLQRFLLRNRDKGIPNLMLYIALGTSLVYLISLTTNRYELYSLLVFDKSEILRGQVWRLVTWIFTDVSGSGPLMTILAMYCFYWLGRAVESTIGTFKLNLFYFGGVVIMDIFAMIFCPAEVKTMEDAYAYVVYSDMASYLHLSIILAFATAHPDSRFYLFFLIPIYAWVMALIYLVLVAITINQLLQYVPLVPHALFPLVGLLNYFVFFGGQMGNLLPMSWRAKRERQTQSQQYNRPAPRQSKGKTIQFPNGATPNKGKVVEQAAYTHRCSVCGRTDVSHPELEFRYCSRCHGYHCYCQDHISNHEHITEE